MLRFVWGQLVNRPSRPAVLALTVLVAAASFVLLTATGQTTEARVQGSVESNYRTPIEREQGLVRNNYLSGLFGGITMKQWREIKAIPGVDVAAPIANIGFIMPSHRTALRIDHLLNQDPIQLYRVSFEGRAQGATSRYKTLTSYVYYTRTGLARPLQSPDFRLRELRENAPGGELDVCGHILDRAPEGRPPFSWTPANLSCFFERSPGEGSDTDIFGSGVFAIKPGQVGTSVQLEFPLLIAGIDPAEEARLVGLDRTVVAGRYLRAGEGPTLQALPSPVHAANARSYHRLVPVIASSRTYVDDEQAVRTERLEIPPGTDVARVLASPRSYTFLSSLGGRVVDQRVLTAEGIYQELLERDGKVGAGRYWTAAPVRYRNLSNGVLRPQPVVNPISIWATQVTPGSGPRPIGYAPRLNADLQFRKLRGFPGSPFFRRFEVPNDPLGTVYGSALVKVVGQYDPRMLRSFSPLSEVPLETYYPPALQPADEASKRALGGRPLRPSQNVGDYIAQAPLFLTTLEGMRPFLRAKNYTGASEAAPISVIRVRVADVAGPDELSQRRVNAVAAQIRSRTGLEVDITAGSSPRKLLVELPAGKFGRPKLLLEEGWSKKGVSVSFLEALDRKRLALFSLVLVASAFFLANGAFAVVRARRREIGTLLCIGWSQRTIFRAILGELAVIGLIAGVLGAVLAWQLASSFELDLPLWRSVAVVPMAVVLAVGAGLLPAWRAARSLPLDAVRPAVAGEVKGRRVRGLAALARANVRRSPARSLVAAGGLFVGVYALTVLLAVNDAFQGSLVGSVLGEAITLQVSGLDFVSVGLVIALAGLSLADVLYLNLRERAAELATLRTLGWRERHLATVIGLEALWLGAGGSLTGATAGLATGWALGVPAGPLALAATIAAAGGIAVALLASLVPLARLSTLTPSTALAEE